jgi:hypothetical protein
MAVDTVEPASLSAQDRRWSPRATALFSVGVSLAFWFVAGLIFSTLV